MQNKKILFLEQFTQSLIQNYPQVFENFKKENIRELKEISTQTKQPEIKSEKQEEFEQSLLSSPAYNPTEIRTPMFLKNSSKILSNHNQQLPESHKIKKTISRLIPTKKMPIKTKSNYPINILQTQKTSFPKPKFERKPILPEYQSSKFLEDLNLGKVNLLIRDSSVSSIECPGPGKFILVRKRHKVNVTKITLTEQEIKDILERISEKAKIPLIGGVFRAAIGNVVFTALESEYVGTRFIITKINPTIQQIKF